MSKQDEFEKARNKACDKQRYQGGEFPWAAFNTGADFGYSYAQKEIERLQSKSEMKRKAHTNPNEIIQENLRLRAEIERLKADLKDMAGILLDNKHCEICQEMALEVLFKYRGKK